MKHHSKCTTDPSRRSLEGTAPPSNAGICSEHLLFPSDEPRKTESWGEMKKGTGNAVKKGPGEVGMCEEEKLAKMEERR